jgi:hypothetical protein
LVIASDIDKTRAMYRVDVRLVPVFLVLKVVSMAINYSDLPALDVAASQATCIQPPVSPFESYRGEFIAKDFSDDTWEISHRDSHSSALLSRAPLVPGPCGQQWLVAHSLCSGVATFATLQDAESHIAMILRLSARHACESGICKATIADWVDGRDASF